MTMPWGAASRDELKEGMWVWVGDKLGTDPRYKKQIKEIRREETRTGNPLYGGVGVTVTVTVFFTDGSAAGEEVHLEWTGVAFDDDGWADAEGKCWKCGEQRLAFKAVFKDEGIVQEEGVETQVYSGRLVFGCRACGERKVV